MRKCSEVDLKGLEPDHVCEAGCGTLLSDAKAVYVDESRVDGNDYYCDICSEESAEIGVVFAVKFTNGKYLSINSYGYYNQTNKKTEVKLFDTYEEASHAVDQELEDKQAFLDDPEQYVPGTVAEQFDCNVVKWTISEQEEGII